MAKRAAGKAKSTRRNSAKSGSGQRQTATPGVAQRKTARRGAAPRAGYAHSLRELGRGVGRSTAVVHRWTRRPDWPFGDGPWEIAAVKAWAAKNLRPPPDAGRVGPPRDPESMSLERKFAVLLKKERIETIKWAREKAQEKYIRRDRVEREGLQRIRLAKRYLLDMQRRLTTRLAGRKLSAEELDEIFQKEVHDTLKILAGRGDA